MAAPALRLSGGRRKFARDRRQCEPDPGPRPPSLASPPPRLSRGRWQPAWDRREREPKPAAIGVQGAAWRMLIGQGRRVAAGTPPLRGLDPRGAARRGEARARL